MMAEEDRAGRNVWVSTILYWLLLLGFLLSYVFSGNSISLVLTADRIVDAAGMTIVVASRHLVKLPPTSRLTYGFHRFESLASMMMIIAFILVLIYSGYESFASYSSGIHSGQMLTIYSTSVSLVVLPVISFLLRGNENYAAHTMGIHAVQDTVTSIMGLSASILIIVYGLFYLELVVSVIIIFLSLYLNRKVMARNLRLLMEGTELNAEEIEAGLKERFPMVHHIHIWDVCRHYRLATAHVYADRKSTLEDLESVRGRITEYVSEKGINHLTVQFEAIEDAK